MQTMSRATGTYNTRFYRSEFVAKDLSVVMHRRPNEVRDWEGWRRRAHETGELPPAPTVSSRKKFLASVAAAVSAGDVRKLIAMEIGDYNSDMRAIGKYRDICVIALMHRRQQGVTA